MPNKQIIAETTKINTLNVYEQNVSYSVIYKIKLQCTWQTMWYIFVFHMYYKTFLLKMYSIMLLNETSIHKATTKTYVVLKT